MAFMLEPIADVLLKDLPASVVELRLHFLPRLLEKNLSRWLGCSGETSRDRSYLLVPALPAACMDAKALTDITLFIKMVKFSTFPPVLYRAAQISGQIICRMQRIIIDSV